VTGGIEALSRLRIISDFNLTIQSPTLKSGNKNYLKKLYF
jgi:hypothetical protein